MGDGEAVDAAVTPPSLRLHTSRGYRVAGASGAGQLPGMSTPLTLTSTQLGGVIWILIFCWTAGGGGRTGVGAATTNCIAFEAQTPVVPAAGQDPGLVTWTPRFPTLTTSAASTPIVTCVAEPKITVRAWPPTVALRPLTKPVPVTARLKPALPEVTGLGVMLFNVGL